jgi:hypothetical protein
LEIVVRIFGRLLAAIFVNMIWKNTFTLDTFVGLENHVIVGELLEVKTAQNGDMNTPRSLTADANWSPDSEASQVTGGYSIGLSLTVLQVLDEWSQCIWMSVFW